MKETEAIKNILNEHRGHNNKITARQIAHQLKISEGDTFFLTRKLILDTIKEYKLPVAADSCGYYTISSDAEYNEYIDNLASRIAGMEARMELVTQNYKRKR